MQPYTVSSEQNVTSMRHREFYDASRAHYFNWLQARADAPAIANVENLSPDEAQALAKNQTLKNAARWGLIVFSAFTLETFINFYAEINKMQDRREKELKYGTKKKWRSYPNLVASKNIDANALKCIEEIFDLRDILVHFKPVTGQNEINTFFSPQNGRAMLNKVHCAVRSLDDLKAPFKSTTWIGEDFEDAVDWASDVTL